MAQAPTNPSEHSLKVASTGPGFLGLPLVCQEEVWRMGNILGLKAMTDFQLELKYFNITSTGKCYTVCTSGTSAWNK